MAAHRLLTLALLLGVAQAAPLGPPLIDSGVPSGACSPDRVRFVAATAAPYCCVNGSWAACGVAPAVTWDAVSGKPATYPATTPVASATTAATATALAADGSDCTAGQAARGVDASGVATGCFTPAGTYSLPDAAAGTTGGVRLTGDLGGTATSPSVVDDSHAHTASTISGLDVGDIATGTLPQARGGTGAGALTCSAGQHLTSNGTAYSCSADTGSYTLPDATSGVTGGIRLTGQLGGSATSPTVVGVTGAVVGVANLSATGTPSASTYLRGDGSWQTPAGGGGVGTMTRLTAAWASSATANTLGIIGTGGVPMTSPSYGAAAPFSFRCVISTTRAATTNGPRYGIQSSGTVTRISTNLLVGLAGTAPARTQNIQELLGLATTSCAANCTSAITASTAARVMNDIIEGTGVMNASGTLSVVMAPSAAAANTAQIGSYCVWY